MANIGFCFGHDSDLITASLCVRVTMKVKHILLPTVL